MRKRWRWNPGPFMAAWFFGGLLTVAGIAIFTEPHHHHPHPGNDMSTALAIALAIWLTPVVIGGAAVLFVTCVGPSLWAARPRRVGEPVHDDLREVWKP
jgi:hypothetical protein